MAQNATSRFFEKCIDIMIICATIRIEGVICITMCIGDNKEKSNMENNYVYPAYIQDEDGGKVLVFPDFEEIVVGIDADTDYIQDAQAELALVIIGYLDEGRELPKRSEYCKDAIYIHVWLPYFRNMTKEVYVKKTVTIPVWLDELAKNGKINYSACMVRGIKEELGLE